MVHLFHKSSKKGSSAPQAVAADASEVERLRQEVLQFREACDDAEENCELARISARALQEQFVSEQALAASWKAASEGGGHVASSDAGAVEVLRRELSAMQVERETWASRYTVAQSELQAQRADFEMSESRARELFHGELLELRLAADEARSRSFLGETIAAEGTAHTTEGRALRAEPDAVCQKSQEENSIVAARSVTAEVKAPVAQQQKLTAFWSKLIEDPPVPTTPVASEAFHSGPNSILSCFAAPFGPSSFATAAAGDVARAANALADEFAFKFEREWESLLNTEALSASSANRIRELETELARELEGHRRAALAIDAAWKEHSELRTEALAAEAALGDSELRTETILNEFTAAEHAVQRLADREETLIAATLRADACEQVIVALRSELVDLSASEAEAAAAGSLGGQQADSSIMVEQLREAMELLQDKLADTQYALEITSEAAAEDVGGGEVVGVREARRLRTEVSELQRSLRELRSLHARGDPSHKSCAHFGRIEEDLEPGADFFGDGRSTPRDTSRKSSFDAGVGKNSPDAALVATPSLQHLASFSIPPVGSAEAYMSLQAALEREVAAGAEVREEARSLRQVLDEARASALCSDDIVHLRVALAEETARSKRLGEHALRAELSRRRLLQKLVEDAEADDGLPTLSRSLGRAARAIIALSNHAGPAAAAAGSKTWPRLTLPPSPTEALASASEARAQRPPRPRPTPPPPLDMQAVVSFAAGADKISPPKMIVSNMEDLS